MHNLSPLINKRTKKYYLIKIEMRMKRFTLWTLALLLSVTAFAQKRVALEGKMLQSLPVDQLMAPGQIKQAPASLQKKFAKKAATRRSASDYIGDYTWDYETASETSTDLKTLETSKGSAHVTISAGTEENTLIISGMFTQDLTASVEEDEDGEYISIARGQKGGTSSYGDYNVYGLFYYEGDEQYDAGWYYGNIYGSIEKGGIISITPWIVRVLTGGQYDGYRLTPYWVTGSTLTPTEPLTVVELPEGLTIEEYTMTYEYQGSQAAKMVNVAVDGNDVYFQGLSEYIPEAWVKGTKDGNTVTFAAMQYVGTYSGYTSFAFYNGDAVFTYDATADTYSAEGNIYGVLGERYYDGNYTDPVLKKVKEVAAMPANPAITSFESSNYGYIVKFNVPSVDVNGNDLVISKLSYQLFSDINSTVAPLTFTPATHKRLTEDMTIIPYGFTESYDFYDTQIYLNDLASTDWNKIGIKSIYTGGGETNETEIQWYDIDWIALGISDVKANVKATNGAMFNLAGQRVAEGYKGLVIKNGKKYVVK